MSSIKIIILWIMVRWKSIGLAVGGLAVVGRAVMWFINYRLARASLRKLQREEKQLEQERARLEQAKVNHRIQSFAGRVLMWMDMEKRRLGAVSVLASEDNLRILLEGDADKLPLVMTYLVNKGKAKREPSGFWSLK